MDCKQVWKDVYLFFDDEMERPLRVSYEEHLGRCPKCYQSVSYKQKVLLIFRTRCGRRPAPNGLRRRILVSLPHRQKASTAEN
ncbi:MAG: zf-HC2 domain-containing protein [Acidobacteriota bacterium]